MNFELCVNAEDAEVIEHLTRVKGVGVWTVHMFLISALRRHDVLPTGDYGVRAAMKKAYGLAEMPKPEEMERTRRSASLLFRRELVSLAKS